MAAKHGVSSRRLFGGRPTEPEEGGGAVSGDRLEEWRKIPSQRSGITNEVSKGQ